MIVKKVIVNCVSEKYCCFGCLMEIGVLFKLEVFILKDEVMLIIDISGVGLYKCGYCLV